MRRPVVQLILFGMLVPSLFAVGPALSQKSPGFLGSSSGPQDADRERLEYSFLSAADWLEKNQQERSKLQGSIENLQEKIAYLRRQVGPNPNVIDEMRLKSNLNELQDQLQTDATLQRQQEEKQRQLEQQGTLLVSLYNDQIEAILGSSENQVSASVLDSKLELLTLYVRKRGHVQSLLSRFQSKNPAENLHTFLSSVPPKGNDKESLQLTLDLFHDRKTALEERLTKWSAEEEQVKNELKLQGKMREFMEDFQGMNDLPQTRVKEGELQGLVGKNQKNNLEARLSNVQGRISQGQKTLAQITQMMGRIQYQLDKFQRGVIKK